MAKGPYLPNLEPIIAAGIDPKTGLPIKCTGTKDLASAYRKCLRIIDEQDAIRRYQWFNLPNGLDGELIERILYYRAQGMFFYMEPDDKFYFLPYALAGSIDVYGRFTAVTPLPFNGKSETDKAWITGLNRIPIYDLMDIIEKPYDYQNTGCILLYDYCKQFAQTNIPRQLLNDPIVSAMSEAFPMARTSLIANSGIKGMRVADQDSETNVKLASSSVTQAALNGEPWIPITSMQEFQDLTSAGSAMKSEEYLLYMQSLDNLRLQTYGLPNGGLFQKKAHELQSEADLNSGSDSLIYNDGLTLRQSFCDLVNALWGLGIWCDISESAIGVDQNMDGEAIDKQDQSGMPGTQPQQMEVIENE